jgi:hypothetical protein
LRVNRKACQTEKNSRDGPTAGKNYAPFAHKKV